MKKVLYIALKEVCDFFRDKGDLAFSLILPVAIFALIYGAFGGSNQYNGTAYIVNEDRGTKYSELFIERLNVYPGLNIQVISLASAERKLERSDIQMAILIPQGFSASLEEGRSARLIFKQRGNGGTEGQIFAGLARSVAESLSQDLMVLHQVRSNLVNTALSSRQIEVTVQQFLEKEKAAPAFHVNETLLGSSPDPVNQFLPGILTMFVLFAVNLTAQAMVDERRKRTLERLMTTRLKVSQLFFGKFLAYMSRGFVQTLILLVLAYAVFRIFTPVSFLEALVVALVFSAASSAIGIIIGSVARTENQATWFAVFFTMLMVMLSGTFVPFSGSSILQTLSKISINTYANDAFRALITEGGSLADVRTQILVLAGVAVVGLVISRFLFRVSQGGK